MGERRDTRENSQKPGHNFFTFVVLFHANKAHIATKNIKNNTNTKTPTQQMHSMKMLATSLDLGSLLLSISSGGISTRISPSPVPSCIKGRVECFRLLSQANSLSLGDRVACINTFLLWFIAEQAIAVFLIAVFIFLSLIIH